MFQRTISHTVKNLSALVLASQFTGCGGGSGVENASNASFVPEAFISGSVGDGPVVGATLNIYDKDGNLIQRELSDSNASYNARIKAPGSAYPLTIEVNDGTDLVTGRAPDFRLVSVVAHPSIKQVNVTPYTTLIVESARSRTGGLNEQNIADATSAVISQLNFGLDPALVADPIVSEVNDSNAAGIIKSSEALGEMIRRARDNLMVTGTVVNADDVVGAIADDITDGVLDGLGGSRASGRIAAVATITAAQVAIEALSNNLKVDGMVATNALDNAILTVQPTAAAGGRLTADVPVNTELLEQARTTLAASRSLSQASGLKTIADILDAIPAGSLPSDVVPMLPGDTSQDLDPVITLTTTTTDEQLAVVNDTVRAVEGGTTTGTTDNTNSAPLITGDAITVVTVGSSYSFQPSASDPDGDTLSFSILNRPAWASFNSSTGLLTGIPASTDEGVYSNIVISVSDGNITSNLPAFSLTVNAARISVNTAPTITGTPSETVVAGDGYFFRPSANDADDDSLTFSISKRPAWATFNRSTGRLTGTPTNTDVGTYSDIVISVSDGKDNVSLPKFSIVVSSLAPQTGSVTLKWAAPVIRADGNALAMGEIAGYTLYYGTTLGNYPNSVDINDANTTSATVSGLAAGTYYFVITTRDLSGLESGYSNVATRLVQ